MLKVTTDEATRTLIIEAHGMISEADIESALDNLQERYPQIGVRMSGGAKGGIRMLLDWEHLEGWENGAKTAGTMTGKMMSDLIRRVAVVADDKWQAEKERITDVEKHAKVRFFALDQRDEAMHWLRDD